MKIEVRPAYNFPDALKDVPPDFWVAFQLGALGLSLTGLGFALGLGVEIGNALGVAG
jgi:hypothetical protein